MFCSRDDEDDLDFDAGRLSDTNVSEKHVSIFWAEVAMLGSGQIYTGVGGRDCPFPTPSLPRALKMETASFSETLVSTYECPGRQRAEKYNNQRRVSHHLMSFLYWPIFT
jgi:hypothetical protein